VHVFDSVQSVVVGWDHSHDLPLTILDFASLLLERHQVTCLGYTVYGDDCERHLGSVEGVVEDDRSGRLAVGDLDA
jgi:hypothetical protein